METRRVVDRGVQYILFISAMVSLVIVFLIALFIFREGLEAFNTVGVKTLLLGKVWRPGQDQYGILAMILGSVLVTIGAIALGVPLAVGGAIFLAEIAPEKFRQLYVPPSSCWQAFPPLCMVFSGWS